MSRDHFPLHMVRVWLDEDKTEYEILASTLPRDRIPADCFGNCIICAGESRLHTGHCSNMAEELGHHYTAVGNIFDQSVESNRKQEYRARLWAYNKSGCQNIADVADYLEVTEDFLQEALLCYRHKYGTYVKLDNYVVYLEPNIGVFEMNGDAVSTYA